MLIGDLHYFLKILILLFFYPISTPASTHRGYDESICFSCHSHNGTMASKISEMSEDELYHKLIEFRDNYHMNQIMKDVINDYSNSELKELANTLKK